MKISKRDLREALSLEARIPGRGTLAMAMAVVIALALALIAMLLWENWVTRSNAMAEARQSVYHESRTLGESAAQTVEIAEIALAHVAGTLQIQEGSPDADSTARILHEGQPWFPPLRTLSMHNRQGRLVAAVGRWPVAHDVSDRPFFRDHQVAALASAVSADEPRGGIRISRRLATPDGGFAGVASAVIHPAAFDILRVFDATRRIDGAAYVLWSGQVLAAWPGIIAGQPSDAADIADIANLPLFDRLPRSALEATGIQVVDTDTAVVAVTPVRNAPFLAAAAISKDLTLAKWRSDLWYVFAATIAIVAVVGIIAIALGQRQNRHRSTVERTLRVLARAIEDSPAMTVIADRDGTIQYANRKVEEISGYGREEIVGAKPGNFKSERTPAATLEALWRTVTAGDEWSGITEDRRRNGEPYWISLSISPITDRNGEVTNFIAVSEDITERIEHERHLRQTEKLEALGTLVGGIAHEFNNMLMPIIGMTGVVSKAMSEGSRELEMMGIVSQAAHKARDLVQRIMVLGRDDPTQWRRHDVSELTGACLAAASAAIPEDIEVRASIPADIGQVHADSSQIEIVMANVVSNAVQAMEGKAGTLSVTLSRADPDDEGARIPSQLSPVPHAVIHVADTGHGIAPDIMGRIFDPFFTTREVGDGAGLGLSITHAVVAAHGGAIAVDSTVGAGTTFRIFLPLVVDS